MQSPFVHGPAVTWLTDDAPFMMGSSRPCVADLLVAEVRNNND